MPDNEKNGLGRIVFLTFPKCGSQWIRDVLTARSVLASSGGYKVGIKSHNQPGHLGLPDLDPGTISGPIYSTPPPVWERFAQPADKAIVVLRDPRDVIVSWMFSAAYSHEPVYPITAYRPALRKLSPQARLVLAVDVFSRGYGVNMRRWVGQEASGSLYIDRYENILADQAAAFGKMFEFLGWQVPETTVQEVVESLSFEKMAGRKRGEDNPYSHYRKGSPGDWRNHFDQLSARFFDELNPDLLLGLGYESNPQWYLDLPEDVAMDLPPADSTGGGAEELEAALVSAREQIRTLEGIAEERLQLINRLTKESEARHGIIDSIVRRLKRR